MKGLGTCGSVLHFYVRFLLCYFVCLWLVIRFHHIFFNRELVSSNFFIFFSSLIENVYQTKCDYRQQPHSKNRYSMCVRTLLKGEGGERIWNVESFQNEPCCSGKHLVSSDLPLDIKFSESPLATHQNGSATKNKWKENGLNQPCHIITLLLQINLYNYAELC